MTAGSKLFTPVCIDGCRSVAVGTWQKLGACVYSRYSSTGYQCNGQPTAYPVSMEYCPPDPVPAEPEEPPFGTDNPPTQPPTDPDPDDPGDPEPDPDGDGDGENPIDGHGLAQSDCDAPPSSEGDPQLHAILMQVWHSQCYGEEVNVNRVQSDLNSDSGLTNSDDLEPEDITDDQSNLVSDAVNDALGNIQDDGSGAGYCPFNNFTATVLSVSHEVDLQRLCDIIPLLRLCFLMMAYMMAGTILLRALNGD